MPGAMNSCPKNETGCLAFRLALWMERVASGQGQQPFRVMFYNVENLFDCRHDSLKEDREFLPDGEKKWTPSRYWRKLDALSKVVAAVGEERLPDLVGLCEVENDSVLFDLTRRSSLRALGYRYVATHSPDVRGIDVALLYQPGSFRLLESHEIPVPSAEAGFPAHAQRLVRKRRSTLGRYVARARMPPAQSFGSDPCFAPPIGCWPHGRCEL